jgi:hypothetical protein
LFDQLCGEVRPWLVSRLGAANYIWPFSNANSLKF